MKFQTLGISLKIGVAFSLLTAACAAPVPTAVPAPTAEAPVTLNVWGGYPEMDAVYQKAADAFKLKHPNVTVTIFSTDLRGFEQKLVTSLPSKTAGDVVIRTNNFLSRFIDEGLFSTVPDDLKALIKGGAYESAAVKESTLKDQVVGVPLFKGSTALFYNTDMLAEAGLAGPPKTMDQIIEYARKLAKLDANGDVVRSGLSLRISGQGSGVAEKFWILLYQYGHNLLKESSPGKWKADYNGPEGVKLFQMYVDFLQEKVDSPNIDHDAKAFETKQTAMFARESWVVADIAKNAPDLVGHYGSVALPVGELGSFETMYVPAASPNQLIAWDFIRFLTEAEQQFSIAELAGWIPARNDLDLKDFIKKNPGFEGFLGRPENFTVTLTPQISEFDEIETKLAAHLVEAYADYANLSGSPEKIQLLLNTWADETNAILKTNGHYDG